MVARIYPPGGARPGGMLAAARMAGPPIPAIPDTPSFNNLLLLFVENLYCLTTYGCYAIMSLQNPDCQMEVRKCAVNGFLMSRGSTYLRQ